MGITSSIGDIEFVPSGPFAGDVLLGNYSIGRLELHAFDAALGIVSQAGTLVFGGARGPWGIGLDPLTDEIFIADYDASAGETAVCSPSPPPNCSTSPPSLCSPRWD